MKKNKLLHFFTTPLIVVMCMGVTACHDDDDPKLDISPTNGTSFDVNGGEKTIEISSNTDWSISIVVTDGDQGWLSCSMSSGSGDQVVSFTASKNTSVLARKATAKFICKRDESLKREISFSQNGVDASLSVDPSSIQFEALGGKHEKIDIDCNASWIVNVDVDWIHLSEENGSGNSTIDVYADDNKETSERSATVTVTVKDSQLSKRVRVKQAAGDNLVVSPLDPRLAADKGSTTTINITANSNWSISGIPSWVSFSSTQGGVGTTTVIITAKEKNFSDQERSAYFSVLSGTKSESVKLTQDPAFVAGISVNVTNELLLSDGYYADLIFSDKVLGYHEAYYYKYAFEVKTEEDIYNEVINDEIYSAKEYNYTIMAGLSPEIDYVYCCVPYSGDSKSRTYGKMLIRNFKTKSNSTYCDASVSCNHNSSYWIYQVTKQQRCHHYYKLFSFDSSAETYSSLPNILLAYYIRDRINDKSHYPNYDYFLNDGVSYEPRSSSDYAFFIWTWGVDDNGLFSGNIRKAYDNTSATANKHAPKKDAPNKNLRPVKKYTRSKLEQIGKNLRFSKETQKK